MARHGKTWQDMARHGKTRMQTTSNDLDCIDHDATQWLYRVHAVTQAESKCVLWCGIVTILKVCCVVCFLHSANKSFASLGAQTENMCAPILWSSVERALGSSRYSGISDCFELCDGLWKQHQEKNQPQQPSSTWLEDWYCYISQWEDVAGHGQ